MTPPQKSQQETEDVALEQSDQLRCLGEVHYGGKGLHWTVEPSEEEEEKKKKKKKKTYNS
jgi:hypothetical protein